MIHIPEVFLCRESEKNELYKPKGWRGNSKAGWVSYQGSWATQEVLLLHMMVDLLKVQLNIFKYQHIWQKRKKEIIGLVS